MTFDELKKTFQTQQSSFTLSIDSNLLLKEVKRNKKHFESAIFWRDIREVGAAFIMFLFFLYVSLKQNIWSLLPLALLVAGVGVFMLVDRYTQKKKRPDFSESLIGCTKSSLFQVSHQIWLLKNVLWWYLLPIAVGMAIFYINTVWMTRNIEGVSFISHLKFPATSALLFGVVYWLNQYAVRKGLNPRKQELEQLLDSLKNSHE